MQNIRTTITQEKIKRFFTCVLAVVLAVALLLPLSAQSAYAEPTSAEIQAEADAASARLAAAEEEMLRIGEEYKVAVAQHEQALAAMDEAQARIDAAQLVINETQERLSVIAAQQYRQGPYSFLDVLFGASSFEEFLTNWEYINFVNSENATLIQTNKDARAEAEAAHLEYSTQEQAAAGYVSEMEALMARAEKKVAEQEAEYAALSSEAAKLVEAEQAARVEERAEEESSNNPDYSGGTSPDIPPGGYGSVVSAAQGALGTPYIPGGTGNPGFDCSGFTQWCYLNGLGVNIGRDTFSQYANASYRAPYTSGEAVPGDVLWWPPSTGYTHVAIYVGGGQYIHSPNVGLTVSYDSWQINELIILRF